MRPAGDEHVRGRDVTKAAAVRDTNAMGIHERCDAAHDIDAVSQQLGGDHPSLAGDNLGNAREEFRRGQPPGGLCACSVRLLHAGISEHRFVVVTYAGTPYDPKNNAQNLNTLLGKVLRIDVRTLPYTIPPDDPLIGSVGSRADIWAYGLHNPWRYSFDAAGTLPLLRLLQRVAS